MSNNFTIMSTDTSLAGSPEQNPSLSRLPKPIRRPVNRAGSQKYLLVTLLSFAASVSLTRLFLEITGYPQLGNSELHIAHVLWGGLLLFVAALLPLIWSNRWVYLADAILAGIGVGLFIDEVGKFITQSNDYFYAPAAPIIYAFFLLTVLLYTQIKRRPSIDTRTELYKILESLEEILDLDLDIEERTTLIQDLQRISQKNDNPDFAKLAHHLLEFLEHQDLNLVPGKPSLVNQWLLRAQQIETWYLQRKTFRAVLAGGMVALGIHALWGFLQLLAISFAPSRIETQIYRLVEVGRISETSINWFAARLTLEGLTGLLLFIAAIFLILGKEVRGVALSYLSLLLSLAVTNLIVFYFDQFSTILLAAVQFGLLLGILRYRHRYLQAPITSLRSIN